MKKAFLILFLLTLASTAFSEPYYLYIRTTDRYSLDEKEDYGRSKTGDVVSAFPVSFATPGSEDVKNYLIIKADLTAAEADALLSTEDKVVYRKNKIDLDGLEEKGVVIKPGVSKKELQTSDVNAVTVEKTEEDILSYRRGQKFYAKFQHPIERAMITLSENVFAKTALAFSVVTKTVKTSGGDYATITSCEDNNDGDLQGADTQVNCEAYGASTTYSERVSVAGATVDATRFLKFTTATADRHNSTYSTGVLIESTADFNPGPWTISTAYTVVEGFRIRWSAFANNKVVDISANNVTVRYNVIKLEAGGGGSKWVIDCNASTNCYAYRNVVQDMCGSGLGTSSFSTPSVYLYGNTIECGGSGNGIQYAGGSNTGEAKNNVVCNASTDYVFRAGVTHTNNASDSTGGEIDSITCSSMFTDYANNDFHLVSGATPLINAGTSLGSPYDDVDAGGNAMSGATDVGALEYVSSSTVYFGRGIARGVMRGVMR